MTFPHQAYEIIAKLKSIISDKLCLKELRHLVNKNFLCSRELTKTYVTIDKELMTSYQRNT